MKLTLKVGEDTELRGQMAPSKEPEQTVGGSSGDSSSGGSSDGGGSSGDF